MCCTHFSIVLVMFYTWNSAKNPRVQKCASYFGKILQECIPPKYISQQLKFLPGIFTFPTHSLTHVPTHSLTHTPTHPLTHSLTLLQTNPHLIYTPFCQSTTSTPHFPFSPLIPLPSSLSSLILLPLIHQYGGPLNHVYSVLQMLIHVKLVCAVVFRLQATVSSNSSQQMTHIEFEECFSVTTDIIQLLVKFRSGWCFIQKGITSITDL